MRGRSILIATIFFSTWISSFAASNADHQLLISGKPSESCGISIELPSALSPDGKGKLLDCLGSYKSDNGTVLSLAPQGFGIHDPSWVERIPSLNIRRVGIDQMLRKKDSFIVADKNGNVHTRKIVPSACAVATSATSIKLNGRNWRGWLVEDIYKNSNRKITAPEYCQRYSSVNRCIRIVIGNSKSSATMQQYCVTRNAEDFDLDSGLSYNILLEMIKTIQFNED
ncbi:hypothetical protein B0G81_4491 [Paraburkholderia sp. BL6665CI2N2]|nr:hypothetical protein B0G81_4491 [Paraburkholderia sp. BL6665CI2N2]